MITVAHPWYRHHHSLRFPAEVAPDACQAEAPAIAAPSLENVVYGTLLIIDDEEMVRLVTAEYSQFGFEVVAAVNGEEGVRLFCQQARPDRLWCSLT